jgi:fused signal recognition particle receptor
VDIALYVVLGLILLVALVVLGVRLVSGRGAPPVEPPEVIPGVGDDASEPRDTPLPTIEEVVLPEQPGAPTIELERPKPTKGRLAALKARLARSNSALGRGLLALLSSDRLDEATWEEIEDTLIMSDLGVEASGDLVERLRTRLRVEGDVDWRTALNEELLALVDPGLDRTLVASRQGDRPAVIMVVGVNGTGKTTTTGKLARVLVADGHTVVLGAADTFRAAAADQLQTWGDRVGARVVRGPEAADPAAGATAEGADCVVIDTAGRLHTKVGLMDELGKIKRVVTKQGPVDEVLLVLDATTGQNGLTQARVFSEVVDVTGVVLTKLDGTAKGGIVVAVQKELGVPVKLVGLGEGPDDLAPFDPEAFVSALLD